MFTEYRDKTITVYDEWLKKASMIASHKYDIDLNNYKPKYNFEAMYQMGLSPRELVERLAKKELDLPS